MQKRLFNGIIFLIGISLIVSLTRSIIDTLKKSEAVTYEEERFAKVKNENEELKITYENLQTPQYVEKQARDSLGLGREGEVVVILPPDLDRAQVADNKQANLNTPVWREWLELIF